MKSCNKKQRRNNNVARAIRSAVNKSHKISIRKTLRTIYCDHNYQVNEARRMETLKAIQEDMNFVDCYDAEGNYLGVANEDIKPNGNGPQLAGNDNCVIAYQVRKKKWLDNFKKSHDVTSEFLKEHNVWPPHKFMRRNPWYMLLKRESVPMCKKLYTSSKLNHTEFMEGYVQHKLKKWEVKNPCPVQKDDMFYSQQYPEWEQRKQNAEERLRDLIINKYTKLPLIGRFHKNHSDDEQYIEKDVALIKDEDNELSKANNDFMKLNENGKLLTKAKAITKKIRAKDSRLVCTNLRDYKRQRGRILLPELKAAA